LCGHPGLNSGYTCPACDHRQSRVWVGAIEDWYTINVSGLQTNFDSAEGLNRKTTLHELGHLVGGLAGGSLLVDEDPPTAPPPTEYDELVQNYGIYADSVMFYVHDADYFNVPHVRAVRGQIPLCLYE
jgi:hypothetical protein